ncbi:MAG: bifunctional 3-deoxy-7-phosphoheptulonate synthase/chorismate mutase type II [Flavobacteriales bacterium]|jgi:chorismate mutase|nr:bifunctional 3-deoxy-7-phosphoheptulonate synthase/chorismate mutase type II [Flavobacteriales bacterium]
MLQSLFDKKNNHRCTDFIWSGPCSAESYEQVFETASQLKQKGIETIRAGIWKPRTRPNSFEGIGYPALDWMADIKNKLSVEITTEVASAKHVEACLKSGFDALWIGARTTVNPFLVQEIAESLRGVDIPVFIKNPIHAEIGLWIGAIERFEQMNISKIGNIFRGFHTMNSAPYRNQPVWKLALEVKRQFPGIPMICDPSHIAGKRNLLKGISQTAIDLNFDGLMLESHINPDSALSDSLQQLTPANLFTMLEELVQKKDHFINPEIVQEFQKVRVDIDQLDKKLLEIIENRAELIDKIGDWKDANQVQIFQLERYQQILESRKKYAKDLQYLPQDFVQELFELIHKFSIAQQLGKNQ